MLANPTGCWLSRLVFGGGAGGSLSYVVRSASSVRCSSGWGTDCEGSKLLQPWDGETLPSGRSSHAKNSLDLVEQGFLRSSASFSGGIYSSTLPPASLSLGSLWAYSHYRSTPIHAVAQDALSLAIKSGVQEQVASSSHISQQGQDSQDMAALLWGTRAEAPTGSGSAPLLADSVKRKRKKKMNKHKQRKRRRRDRRLKK